MEMPRQQQQQQQRPRGDQFNTALLHVYMWLIGLQHRAVQSSLAELQQAQVTEHMHIHAVHQYAPACLLYSLHRVTVT